MPRTAGPGGAAPRRILVVGAGALGIVAAVRLSVAGYDVVVAVKDQPTATRLWATGLTLTVGDRPTVAHLSVISKPSQLGRGVDMVINATKCSAALAAGQMWIEALKPAGVYVPFQNGLLGDQHRAIAGERLIECAVFYPATLVEKGRSLLTGHGHLHVGRWPRANTDGDVALSGAAHALQSIVPTYIHADMWSVKWNKLVANSAMTSLGVVSGLNMNRMMATAAVRQAFLELLDESLRIAVAAGARPMSLGGFNPSLVSWMPRFAAHIALRFSTRRHGDYRSSSQQSLDRGQVTEVDFLNGRVVEEAERRGLAAPWNTATVKIVHAIESGSVAAGSEAVQHLASSASLLR